VYDLNVLLVSEAEFILVFLFELEVSIVFIVLP